MKKSIITACLVGAFVLTLFMGTSLVPSKAHAATFQKSNSYVFHAPASSLDLEIVETDGTTHFEAVGFRRHYNNVDYVINGTNSYVKYIVGYVLWVFPIYSPPIGPLQYYSVTGNNLYGADYE